MSNWNQEHRRFLILNMIYQFGPISRTELTSLIDHRPGTVGEIIKDFLDEQLIVETGALPAGMAAAARCWS